MTSPAVAIVIPVRNEAAAIGPLAAMLARLDPPCAEVLVVDGDSTDGTAEAAAAAHLSVIRCATRGRAAALNAAVAACSSPLVCMLHADTRLPTDAMAVIGQVMADPLVALAGFMPVICGERLRWATTAHNWAKTWYAPMLFRPILFARGGRLLFGDHAMFCRRADYLAVGGCDERLIIMEDADLCVRLSRRGRVRLVRRFVVTSDRRIAQWGAVRANWIYVTVTLRWALGARRGLRYPEVR